MLWIKILKLFKEALHTLQRRKGLIFSANSCSNYNVSLRLHEFLAPDHGGKLCNDSFYGISRGISHQSIETP